MNKLIILMIISLNLQAEEMIENDYNSFDENEINLCNNSNEMNDCLNKISEIKYFNYEASQDRSNINFENEENLYEKTSDSNN